MEPKPRSASLRLEVKPDDSGCDIRLSDVSDLADLAAELAALLELSDRDQTLHIALLPPVPAGLSLPLALRAIVDTWASAQPASRPAVECRVASQTVSDSLAPLLPGEAGAEGCFDVGELTVCAVEGDITATYADALVNASNRSLRLGGGVSGALRRACGPGLQAEMASLARRHPLADGDAVVTGSHGLKTAASIIHVASAAGDDTTVAKSLRSVLRISNTHRFNSVALPALGTGSGGLPLARFAGLLITELQAHRDTSAAYPRLLRIVLYRRSEADFIANELRGALGAVKYR